MHAIKGGWSGHVAVSASNDSGGRKSRIRRSKEERKDMVESFIKKYQISNNGNFPSLNLTHKEVGGSFYTVRQIVREIIQENRVLAPPKVSLEEDDLSGFLEQHPLGSVSMEPMAINLSGSNQIHLAAHSVVNEHSEVHLSNSSIEFLEPSPLIPDSEQIIEGLTMTVEREEISNGTGGSHYASGNFSNREFKNGRIVNDVEVPEESPQNDEQITANLSEEQRCNGSSEVIDKTREFSERIFQESVFVEVLDREKTVAGNVEASQAAASHMNSDIVVEKFPLRPFPRKVHDEDGGPNEVAHVSVQNPSNFFNKKDANVLLDSKDSTASDSSEPGADVRCLEPKTSLPDGTKVKNSIEHSIFKNSTAIQRKFNGEDDVSLSRGNNLPTDRINFETPTKSTRLETNPLVVLLKGIVSSFIKFWTE